jgi:hypothetical protein
METVILWIYNLILLAEFWVVGQGLSWTYNHIFDANVPWFIMSILWIITLPHAAIWKASKSNN